MKDNVFLILCKHVTRQLYVAYSEIGMSNLYFISDDKPAIDKPNVIHYSDDMMMELNFRHMHNIVPVSSWDKAIYFLSTMIDKPPANYWLVEDDCYLNSDTFIDHVNQTTRDRSEDLLLYGWYKSRSNDSWYHWRKNHECFEDHELRASITQVVRVSDRLMDKVIDFRNTHDKFIFHELLFASLARRHHMQVHIHEGRDVHICALKPNSLIHKNYNNQSNRQIIQDLKRKQYTIVHPFKNWYK